MTDVVELSGDDIPAAGRVLARALFDDALARHMYPEDDDRRRHTPWHFSALARYGKLFGRVLTTPGEPKGVAIWFPPGEADMTETRLEAAGLDASPAMLGEAAFSRFATAMAQIEPFRERDMTGPHWYLALLGVDPGHAGQGIGSALLKPVLRRADSDGLPCYLETAEERNVGFYRKHGFETLRSGTVSGIGIPYWTMSRPPGRG